MTPKPVLDDSPDIQKVRADSLVLDPKNLRKHGKKNRQEIRSSIKRFGSHRRPVVQRSTRLVLIGNGQVLEMMDMGYEWITVQFVDDDDREAAMRAYADNATALSSEWDEDAVARVVPTFDTDFLSAMHVEVADFEDPLGEDDVQDPVPPKPPANPETRPGHLIHLGDHVLLCGDSTNREDVRKALAVQDAVPKGRVIYDPFTGSGSTLLACEQTGRVFRGIELDPAYCDVIIARWEELTGKKAVRA